MNRYKQPKTEWMTKAWEDKQAICKLVEWSKTEGIGLIVIKPQNEIYPELFYFVFSPETADINKPVEIALVKNKRDGEIPVSWILRKLSDAVCKVAAETVR